MCIRDRTNAVLATGGDDTVYSSLAAYTLTANVETLRLVATGAADGSGNSLNLSLIHISRPAR